MLSPTASIRPRKHAVQPRKFDDAYSRAVVTLSAVIHREGDLYVAECPELGTVSQGKTLEEGVANLKEATGLYLEEQEERPPFPDRS
jgi:predicted RNase H-like HicB family nuclease